MNSKNREEELNEIWEKTLRYKTANSEIAALPDLYAGLEKSGYSRETYQREDHLHLCTEFVVFEKDKLNEVLETLETHKRFSFEDKWFFTRLNGIEYKDRRLGVHPSSILNADDLYANPMLLTLLIGELYQSHYFDRNIIYDEDNREVILRYYGIQGDPPNWSRRDLSSSEANDISQKIAHNLTRLSSLEKRNKMNHMDDAHIFEKELELGGNLGLSLEDQNLCVSGEPIYEVGQIPKAQMVLRIHENKLEKYKGKNENAEYGIMLGIKKQRDRIVNDEGPHYPMFKIIIPDS